VLQAEAQQVATILLNYHIGCIVLGWMCVGVSVWLGWSGNSSNEDNSFRNYVR